MNPINWGSGQRLTPEQRLFIADCIRRHKGNIVAAGAELRIPEINKTRVAALKLLSDIAIRFSIPKMKGMKNEVRISGTVAVITLRQRDGGVYYTKIDAADLQMLREFGATWCVAIKTCGPYAVAKNPDGSGNVYLHRLLMDAPLGMEVDHRWHDTLDNRRKKLRVVTHQKNQFNRKGASRHGASGIRGVRWHKLAKKWMAQVTFNKKLHYLGLFVDRDKAEATVIAFRERVLRNVNS